MTIALSTDDDLLDTRQAAALSRYSIKTLAMMRVAGTGPPFIKPSRSRRGGRVFYSRRKLVAWLEAATCSRTADNRT